MLKPYWQQGNITIYHGRCEDILPALKGQVVISDPPYNAGKNYGPEINDARPWPEWCAWWNEILELCLQAAPDVLAFLSQTAYAKYLRLGQRPPDWTLAWIKPLSLAVCAMPFMPHWEPIAYWGSTRKKDGAFWGSDVLQHNVGKKNEHPTPKPLALMRDLVSRFPGPIIDPFMGSGTTLRAARDLGKHAIGIEVVERWCELAARRLEQWADEPSEQLRFALEMQDQSSTGSQRRRSWGLT